MIYWIFITIINWFVALSLTLALCLALQLYFSISPIAFSTTLYILLSILRPQLFSLFPITIHPSMFFSLSFPVQLWLLLLYFSLPLILLHPYCPFFFWRWCQFKYEMSRSVQPSPGYVNGSGPLISWCFFMLTQMSL